ncbi:uncharacterized protein EAE97_007490 [Botrytis byssoidea]|uniref:AMP-dependent synthetase/ligase domain-containing protein n=1 Tax=Botrytis byssoidea TaxID=139641 RepID=A0A9P5IEX5_9HELO|nr:uncharacterized protein EAE97_007490 [Botrytis byssoidea]KAF7937694.1 hypothetical protein EAE97_007490 [Botrytis byssoidea]
MGGSFKIGHVVAVASKHPFYSSHKYPLSPKEVEEITSRELTPNCAHSLLSQCQIIRKEDLYKEVTRLFEDDDPLNTFRHSTYISMTGGGGGGSPCLVFLTDSVENRAQRKACSNLLRYMNVLKANDCVLSMHPSGKMYRALDLVTEIVENAGASVLPVGHLASPQEILAACKEYGANALTGDTSRIVQFTSWVESAKMSDCLHINKILYTSESMSRTQRSYIQSVFGRDGLPVIFSSLLASAEMGPWAVGCFDLTGPQKDDTADLIFDTRHMIVEVMPLDFDLSTRQSPCRIVEGETGMLIVTSLQRLRNPLVRYVTGDIGSIHHLPTSTSLQLGKDSEHLRVLRLHGRDLRNSFKWQGEYFELDTLKELMSNPSWGIVLWQIVLANNPSNCETLEIRLMQKTGAGGLIAHEDILEILKGHFCAHASNESLFHANLHSRDDFIRSSSGNKVIKLVDRRGKME